MGYFWILKLGLKCIDGLAWPLLALVYPLCASIQAIENDSYSDTKNLISYWILLSLIYLFEYAFMKLLEWFLLWPYFKLMIICWLVIPNFRISFLVYRDFVHPCISINPQGVINRIESWKKFFVKKDNFLLQAEKYIKENGTEALEKLISSENMTPNLEKEVTTVTATGKKEKQQNMAHIEEESVKAVPATGKIQKNQMKQNLMGSLDAETFKEIPATDKKQLPQTNGKGNIEQRYIKVVEKKEVPADKNANPTAPNLALNESKSSGVVDAYRNAGKDHIEQKYIKVDEKKEVPADDNANLAAPNLAQNENKSSGVVDANRMVGKDVEGGELPHSAASKKMQKEWTCAICQVTTTSEETLNIHLHGRKHIAALEALRWKSKIQQVKKEQKNPQIPIATQPGGEREKIILTDAVNQITVIDQQSKGKVYQSIVHPPSNKIAKTTEQLNVKNVNGEFTNGLKGFIVDHKPQRQQKNMGKPIGLIDDNGLRCNLCNVVCTSQGNMASHLNGRRHLACVKSSSGLPVVQDLWLAKGHC